MRMILRWRDSMTRKIGTPARVTLNGTEYVPAEDYDRLLASYRQLVRPSKPAEVAGLNTEAWEEWTKYRRECGKRAYKTDRVARWLAVYPSKTQQEIVSRSINSEWQGLYAPPASTHRMAERRVVERFL